MGLYGSRRLLNWVAMGWYGFIWVCLDLWARFLQSIASTNMAQLNSTREHMKISQGPTRSCSSDYEDTSAGYKFLGMETVTSYTPPGTPVLETPEIWRITSTPQSTHWRSCVLMPWHLSAARTKGGRPVKMPENCP